MEKRSYIIILAILLLLCTAGFFFMIPILDAIDSHFYPRIRPGIWDQPVIRPPDNSSTGLFDYPFMFQYDLNASTGFESVSKKYYRPNFVIAQGKNATIIVDVTSNAKHPVTVTLAVVEDLPAGGISYTIPDSILLDPGQTGHLKLELSASPDASLPSFPENTFEETQQYPVGVWLKSEDWSIGQGFYLKVTP